MQKVIDGKRYDTKTATIIACDGAAGMGSSDFRNWDEELYVTAKGNFFLHGEGGPLTQWAVNTGNGTSGGEDIVPMTRQEAFEWCQQHDKLDAIASHFADLVEDA